MRLLVKIIIGIGVGILLGFYSPMLLIKIISSIGFVLGQYIRFIIPLLIVAFIAKGIVDFGREAGKALLLGLVLAYVSTICAELLGFSVASTFLPWLGVAPGSVAKGVTIVPYLKIEIPAIMSIMCALIRAFIACSQVRTVMPESVPARYALAIWRLRIGWRSAWFFAWTICRASRQR